MAHAPPGRGQERPERTRNVATQLEPAVADEGADKDLGIPDLDPVESRHPADVHQRRRPGEAEVHHRDEALATRQDLGVLAEPVQRAHRLLDGAGLHVLEGSGLHRVDHSSPVQGSSTVS
jgi:hypothetical protein